MAKNGKQYAKISGSWEQIKPSYDDLTDVPTDFNPTSHTHGNITDGGEITASTTIATGDHLVIADDSSGNDLTTSSITFDTSNSTQFLRKDGTFATPNYPSGDITGVTAGTGLSGGGSTGAVSLSVDLSELTDMTADVNGLQDELILLDNGADRKKLISEIKLSQFNNDAGFASGDITNVTAGTGLTGGGSSGSITVNAIGGTGITANANDLAISSTFSPGTATELTSSQDLNDLKAAQAGFYYQTANADTPGNNYPENVAGSLIVQKSAGQVTQIYTTYQNPPKMYMRTYYTSWSSWQRIFADNYHPNADKLTTARNIALSGDLTGNVDFDGSANVTLSAAVANDSHTHDGRYYTKSAVDGYLNAKANLSSPAFTNTPTAPTASAGTNTTQLATTAFVTGAVSDLIGGAPGALDTLNELAAAINDDSSFASSVTTSLAAKAPLASPSFTGNVSVSGTITANGLTVSNDNIVGVNTLEINDPGEGIKFKQGSSGDMELKIVDDSFDSILNFSGTNAALAVNGTTVSLSGHTHDSRYYTESEVDTFLAAKAASSHTHDDRYYTESEVNTLLAGKASSSHSHSDLVAVSGDTMTGDLTLDHDGSGTTADSHALKFRARAANTDFEREIKLEDGGGFAFDSNILLTGDVTTNNAARTIDFTGFDKEGTTDFTDRAYIQHTTNTGGHSGSVLKISSRNDSNDGIAFDTHASSQLKHNTYTIWDAGNDGSGSGLDADLLDGNHASAFYLASNPDGYTTNTGTVTSVQVGVGTGLDVSGGPISTSGTINLSLDLSEFTDMTADVVGSQDELILLDNGAERRKLISEIKLSQFNNDAGFLTSAGDITNVSTGSGLTGGGSAGSVTISHADTSSQASVNNSGRTYIQDITLDDFGHITGITSATETVTNTDTNTQLSNEQVQDIVGAMVSGNSESGISVTYQDGDGTLDFNVNDPTITLTGDVTGTATMTNLGNVSITTAVADDSHNHTISNIDNLQTSLNGKLATTAAAAAVSYVTSCPTSNNTTGMKVYVGSTDCSTKYSGWLYLVT